MQRSVGGVVDFIGLPAAGKTALADATRRRLDELVAPQEPGSPQRITTSSAYRSSHDGPLGIGRTVAVQVGSDPVYAASTLRHLLGTRQQSAEKSVRFLLYHQYLTRELETIGDRAEVHLADQGFFQFLWRVHLTSTSGGTANLRRLAEMTLPRYRPAVVVFVEVDHQTRFARANERGTEMRAELNDPDHPLIQDDIESYQEMKAFVDSLRTDRICSAKIIEIDNADGELDLHANRLATAIIDALDLPQAARSDQPLR